MNKDDMHTLASKLYEDKKLNEALETYKKIITDYCPNDEVALSCIMDIYLELDDKFNYYLARANVNIGQNKYDYAISDTIKALNLDNENIMARRKLARLYKVTNQNLKAIDEFIKIINLSKEEKDAYFELVDLYMKENSIDSALSIANELLTLFPNDKEARNMTAQLYFKANDFEKALEVVEDNLLKIKILLQAEKNDSAKEELEKINYNSLNDNQKASFHILRAQYFYNTHDCENALGEVEAFVKIAKPNPVAFQMKALIYEKLNDEFQAHLNWGFCYKLQGKFDEALVEFDSAYRINEKDKTVLIELANLYQQNKERWVAIEYWQKVYELDGDKQAQEILAEFYYSEGNFRKAEEYGKVVEHKQENYEGFLDKIMHLFAKK